MKLHRFIGAFDCTQKNIVIKDVEQVHQISRVLRLGVGDKCILCDGNKKDAIVEIEAVHPKEIVCKLIRLEDNERESDKKVVLYCSVLKRENFEWVVQKATELGVTTIVPFVCERTVKYAVRADRLVSIAHEAAEQSGRGVVPHIERIHTLDEICKHSEGNKENFVCDPYEAEKVIPTTNRGSVGVCVGPEGGFTGTEIEQMKSAGFVPVSLGKRILRGETAAIVACALALYE